MFRYQTAAESLQFLLTARETGLRQFKNYTGRRDELVRSRFEFYNIFCQIYHNRVPLQENASLTLGPFVYQISLLTDAEHKALVFLTNRKNETANTEKPSSSSASESAAQEPIFKEIDRFEVTQPYLDSKSTLRLLLERDRVAFLGNLTDVVANKIRTIWKNANPVVSELLSKTVIDSSNLDVAPLDFVSLKREIDEKHLHDAANRAASALSRAPTSPALVSTPDRANAAPLPLSSNDAIVIDDETAPAKRGAQPKFTPRKDNRRPSSSKRKIVDEEGMDDTSTHAEADLDGEDTTTLQDEAEMMRALQHNSGYIPDAQDDEPDADKKPYQPSGIKDIYVDGKQLPMGTMTLAGSVIRIQFNNQHIVININEPASQFEASLADGCAVLLVAILPHRPLGKITVRVEFHTEEEATALIMSLYSIQFGQ